MAAGDKIVIPAQAGGFASLFGQVSKGTGNTLNLPEGMLNIGGNGKGYLLSAQIDWDPYSAANNDASFSVLTLGDDIYIYACQQASGIAKWLASKNSTYPTGYTASNSRKVGGFHVGRYRGVANRYSTSYSPVTQILPNSCWDLQRRPKCDPTGMVEVIPGALWVDIYLASVASGTWPSVLAQSKYNQSPLRSTGGYVESDLRVPILNIGKRLPSVEEFLYYAEGAPAGLDANNDQAWSYTGNTGPCNTGAVVKAVSMHNIVDAVGNLWERLDNHHDLGGTFVWDASVVNVGQDAATPRGYVNHAAWRYAIGGGSWNEGVHAGARCLYLPAGPWNALGGVGVRGVCDSL